MLGSRCPDDITARFWGKVNKSGECWLWAGAKNNTGYGEFRSGKVHKAHRFAYELTHGSLSDDLFIDHICGIPACVNPQHLRMATPKQNSENRKMHRYNTSGVRGVTWRKRDQKWYASVGHNGRRIHVGYFTRIEDAEAAVIAKRNELFTHNDRDRVSA